ncbi:MAG: insulinase family protein [Firmicutes bacterium HGW-Firmicutes-16]|nr:MAG: insulinase family protein [Firmicutes bacterium HGW-Firmicutes-16]
MVMFEINTLPNGVRIICEKMPHVRSAAVGIFIDVGSRDEAPTENGSAHFIEHMLFKRTSAHSAAELAFAMDAIGGQINAYTTRENTCFYARVLDTHLNTAVDLLTEMFFDCAFDESETGSERGVILEEIGMYEDTPDDACYERLMSGCFKGALGRPVLGKPSTLEKMSGESLKGFKESRYTAGRIIISLCGNYEDSHLERIKERFSGMEKTRRVKRKSTLYGTTVSVRRKKTEQNQFCLAFPSNEVSSDDRFAMNLLTTILGGGVSSRLFQNIREKYGLCYSIFAFQSCFSDAGILSVATAVNKETEMRTLGLIGDELKRFLDGGVDEDELSRAREQAKSALVMSLESTNSRMLKMGNSLLALGKCLTPDELLERYDTVTSTEILSLAQKRLDFKQLSFSALGKTKGAEDYIKALGL